MNNEEIVAAIIKLRNTQTTWEQEFIKNAWRAWSATPIKEQASPAAIGLAVHLVMEEERQKYLTRLSLLVQTLQAPTIEEDKVAPLIDAKLKTLGRAMRKSNLNKG